ncbi:MAG: hypothetical protein II305_02740 [Clostridia bacterium]|nr:hypothetical protein [Clostridia bacterium]
MNNGLDVDFEMKQCVREFDNFHKHLDDALNDYLKDHPNYSIDRITVLGQAIDKDDRILVVFNIEE